MSENCINISNLSKLYRGAQRNAISDLNLQIIRGEVFGILGPNGAGKTTLFSVLCGILKPSSGTILIENMDLSKNREKIKHLFGIVPQNIALYPTLTVKENLLYIGRMYGMKNSELNHRIEKYIRLFDLEEIQDLVIKKCSGGNQRKVNLIGGLLHRPRLLLLDEPTVGVDVQTRNVIMNHLKHLNEEEKLTILYTSHYIEQAQNFCDRVGILSRGELLKVDTPDRLMKGSGEANLEGVFLELMKKAE